MEKLITLVDELKLQHDMKADYVMAPRKLRMTEDGLLVAENAKMAIYEPNQVWHDGASFMLNIPSGYYKRMMEATPQLLSQNVNAWLDLRDQKGVMLRTFENPSGKNVARAILSDRYNILDNYDVLFAALDAIKKSGLNVEIVEATVTDKRMYLCVTAPQIEVDGKAFLDKYLKEKESETGNGIITGLIITNSEVGQGSYEIRPRALVLKCKNGLIVPDDKFRRVHLGAKLDEGAIQWSEATKQKNYELVISQTTDAINTFLSKDYLNGALVKVAHAHGIHLDHPMDTVQHVCRELMITEEHRQNILDHFLRSGDHTAGGVFQALTFGAQNMGADDRFEIEAKAYGMIDQIKAHDKPFSKN